MSISHKLLDRLKMRRHTGSFILVFVTLIHFLFALDCAVSESGLPIVDLSYVSLLYKSLRF